MSGHIHEAGLAEPLMVADHLALDLLNTEAGKGAMHIDFWHGGDDVLRWLQRAGIDAGRMEDRAAKDALLEDARKLR